MTILKTAARETRHLTGSNADHLATLKPFFLLKDTYIKSGYIARNACWYKSKREKCPHSCVSSFFRGAGVCNIAERKLFILKQIYTCAYTRLLTQQAPVVQRVDNTIHSDPNNRQAKACVM